MMSGWRRVECMVVGPSSSSGSTQEQSVLVTHYEGLIIDLLQNQNYSIPGTERVSGTLILYVYAEKYNCGLFSKLLVLHLSFRNWFL